MMTNITATSSNKSLNTAPIVKNTDDHPDDLNLLFETMTSALITPLSSILCTLMVHLYYTLPMKLRDFKLRDGSTIFPHKPHGTLCAIAGSMFMSDHPI